MPLGCCPALSEAFLLLILTSQNVIPPRLLLLLVYQAVTVDFVYITWLLYPRW